MTLLLLLKYWDITWKGTWLCHSQDWQWEPGFEQEIFSVQRAAQQKSQHLELWGHTNKMTTIAIKKKKKISISNKNSTDNPIYKSTNRSLLCNGCSGILSKTQLFPACQVWWPRRSRTGSATDLSNSRHTRRAREPRTAHTQCTSPWRTVMDRRGKYSALFESTSGQCWVKLYLILCMNATKCTPSHWAAPSVRKATHVVQNDSESSILRDVY